MFFSFCKNYPLILSIESLSKPRKEFLFNIKWLTFIHKPMEYAMRDTLQSVFIKYFSSNPLRIEGQAASKYGLTSQPRLVDIIAAVPATYKKVSS